MEKTRIELIDALNREIALMDRDQLEKLELMARGIEIGIRATEPKEKKEEK